MMKWFKHMSDMSLDVKIKRLIRSYGVEGYGLYNYILELIVRAMDSTDPVPELEEGAEDIAQDLKMDTVLVEKIMWFCLEQGLFEQSEVSGRIVANKIYKFLTSDQTRNPEIKKMISKYTGNAGNVPDSPGQSLTNLECPDQIRLDKIRLDKNKYNIGDSKESKQPQQPKVHRFIKPTLQEIQEYCEERSNSVDPQRFLDYYQANGWRVGKNPMKDWQAAIRTWEKNEIPRQSASQPMSYQDQAAARRQASYEEAMKAVGVAP